MNQDQDNIVIPRDEYKALIEEAIEDISGWGAYADDYFKNKWNLEGDIARWKARLDVLSEGNS